MDDSLFDAVAKLDEKNWIFFGKGLIIAPYLARPRDKLILDAGCGTGPMLGILKRWGKVVGMDASRYALTLASSHVSDPAVTLKEGTVSAIPFAEGTFDVVTLFDVLYHQGVGDDEHAIRECRRVLKPGGLLIILDSAFKFLKASYDEEAHTARRYTLNEMKAKCVRAGFTVRKASYIFFFVFPAVAIMRLCNKFDRARTRERDSIFAVHPLVNAMMKVVMRLEAMLLRVIDLPFGVSVFCVCVKEGSV